MAVEVRAIHAGKLGLAAHGDAAAAAHTRAVDHNRIHAHDGLHAVGLGEVAHGAHHGQGANGDHHVVLFARLQLFLQRLGHKALVAVGAIVGHDGQVGTGGGEFLLQDDQILVAEAHDEIHLGTRLMQRLGLGIGNGHAQSAADHRRAGNALGVAGFAQGADKVQQRIALVQGIQLLGGVAHLLEDDGHGTLFPVIPGNGQRHALALFVDAENNKLAGLRLAGNQRSLDFHQGNCIVQHTLFHNGKHGVTSFGSTGFYFTSSC